MNRVKRVVRLVGLWAVAIGGPGCAFLDEWNEDDGDYNEVEAGRLQPAGRESLPPFHTLEPGVYHERQ